MVERNRATPPYKKETHTHTHTVFTVFTARMPRGNPVTRATPLNRHSLRGQYYRRSHWLRGNRLSEKWKGIMLEGSANVVAPFQGVFSSACIAASLVAMKEFDHGNIYTNYLYLSFKRLRMRVIAVPACWCRRPKHIAEIKV